MICCKKKNVETFEGRVGFGRDYVIFKFMRVYYLNDYFFSFVYFIICIAKRGDTSCRNEEREMQTIERNGIGKGYSRIYIENRNYVHIIILNTETYSSKLTHLRTKSPSNVSIVSRENININLCLEHVSSPRMGQDKKVISFIEKPKLFPIRTIPLYQYVVHCVEFFVDREFRISRLRNDRPEKRYSKSETRNAR